MQHEYDQERAERLILNLRVEIRGLKRRLRDERDAAESGLSPRWQKSVAQLRADCARYRKERNEARAALEALRRG